MHELSIAQAIVDICDRNAGAGRVTRVHVRAGGLRQVVPSALEFSFELCAHGTRVEGARLELELVAAEVSCRQCGTASHPEAFPLACDTCAGLDVEVTAGEELQVQSLELEAELMTSGG